MKYLVIPILTVLFGCSTPETDQVSSLPVLPVKADDISGLVIEHSGQKAVLMNVWATWCIPCIEEFPYIVRVREEFKDQLDVVFISADFPEASARIDTFLTDNRVYWQTYIKDDRDEPFIDAVWHKWTGALPVTVIYTKEGEFMTAFERPASYDEFRDLAIQAIEKQN